MTYTLLTGSYRTAITRLSFDPASEFNVLSTTETAKDPSWVEVGSTGIFACSEAEGTVFSLSPDGKITSQQKTHGNPCHVHILSDGSGVVVSNYIGGSVTLHYISDGILDPAQILTLPYAYEGQTAPNVERQDASHAHGVIESQGRLYAADLGSDRVYIVKKGADGLEVKDWIQCKPGFGPRHCAVSRDGSTLYVLGELSGEQAAYALPSKAEEWCTSYLPPSVPKEYTRYMYGAEVALHPTHDVLYVSNRLELHAAERCGLPPRPAESGDAVTIFDLSGEKVGEVRTGCCCVRGMQVSPDGKFVVVGGECNKTVEAYEISNEGKKWKKVADVELDGITDFAWL